MAPIEIFGFVSAVSDATLTKRPVGYASRARRPEFIVRKLVATNFGLTMTQR